MRALLISVALLGSVYGQPTVTWRNAYWLNEIGGQTLQVKGTGFSTDQFDYFDPNLGNRVHLVNDVDSIDCDIIKYLTNTNTITCTVGARTNLEVPAIYRIEVVVDGVSASGDHYVEFASWLAPKIQYVIPPSGRVGDLVEFRGWLHTDQVENTNVSDPLSTSTRSRKITSAFMGGVQCELLDGDNELYGTVTYNSLTCLPLTRYVGPMNGSVYVVDRGPSVTDKWGMYVNSQDHLYQYHTYAVVSGVSPQLSSSEGRALINVTGSGFNTDEGKTEVTIGGAPCEVKEVNDYWLTCYTPPQADTSSGPGQMGLLFEMWEGVHFTDIENDAQWEALTRDHDNYTSSVLINLKYDVEILANSVGIYSGHLNIPHSGLYSLQPYAADHHILYLAVDGNPDNLKRMSWAEKFEATPDISPYFQIRFRATDNFRFNLVLRDYHALYNYAQTTAVNEYHRVVLNPREKYRTLRVTVEGSGAVEAKLYLNGRSSEGAVNMVDTQQVREALLKMTEQQCQVLGDGYKLMSSTGFEASDITLPNPRGWIRNNVDDPFCGRQVYEMRKDDPRIYMDDTKGLVDANKYRYVCFALRGNTESTMSVRFAWQKKTTNRYDTITFQHEQNYNKDSWIYKCFDLIQVALDSWLANDGYVQGSKLDVYRVHVPKPKAFIDRVYVDQFAFSDQDITMSQQTPSALQSPNNVLIGDIEVTEAQVDGDITTYDIKFVTSNCLADIPLLAVYSTTADPSWQTSLQTATNETFVLDSGASVMMTVTQDATGRMSGTWDLTLLNRTLKGLDPYITRENLEIKLNTGFGTTSGFRVSETIKCDSNAWYIEYFDYPGRQELLLADISNIVFDGEITESVGRNQEGQVYHDPITPDFLTVRTANSQVVLKANGYTAACDGSCDITYDDSDSPSLTSLTDADDGLGTYTLTVTGTGFTVNDPAAYTVQVGGQECLVSDVTTNTQVICSVQLSAGTHTVTLSMQPIGAATNTLPYDVPLTLSTIDPVTGGTGGGYQATLTGEGFPNFSEASTRIDGNYVKIGGNECEIVMSNYNQLKCVVPPGSVGSASLEVMFGDKTATLSSFSYDASLSATMDTVAPASLSVLGGDLLTISGTNFGSVDDGSVKVGDSECVVQTWIGTSITCTPPSLTPGTYPVTVTTSQGMASGSASVTYLLTITSSSPPQGSTKGGFLLVLKGQGFGTNCSLIKVQLGNTRVDECEVVECSDTSVTCQVRLVPKTHLVTNEGTGTEVGVSWEPGVLDIREGDSVLWKWEPHSGTSTVTHNIYQTLDATNDAYNGFGFVSGAPTVSGIFKATFPHASTVYYGGDSVAEDLVLRGQINVNKPTQAAYRVTLTVADFQALYQPEENPADVRASISGCSDLMIEPLAGCNVSAPVTPTTDNPTLQHLYLTTHTCLTPTLTAVTATATENIPGLSGLTVKAGTTLTLTGSGFGTTSCQNQVTVGGATCTITAAAENSLTCDLDDMDNIVATQVMPIEVIVWNRGQAEVIMTDYNSMGQVTFVPVVSSFSPTQGSINGGTRITITGSGLRSKNEMATVTLDDIECEVESITATSIICITKAHAEGEVAMIVKVNQVTAILETTDIFNYAEAATPVQSTIASSGSLVTISGSNFGSDTSKVSVKFIPISSTKRRKRGLKEEVHKEILKGNMNLQEEKATIDENPILASINRVIEDADLRVMEEQLHQEEELKKEAIVQYEETQEYHIHRDVRTERVRRYIKPKMQATRSDPLGKESSVWGKLTNTNAKNFRESRRLGLWRFGGSGIRAEAVEEEANNINTMEEEERTERSVDDGSILCTSTSVTDTQITCEAAELSAGSYDVVTNICGLGDANTSSFTVEHEVTTVDPTEGSTNGGTLITFTGSGFDPSDVAIVIGDTVCDVVSATTTSVSCRTMSHVKDTLPVSVTSGGTEKFSPSNFTYSEDATPVLSSALPTVISVGDILTLSYSIVVPSGSDPEVLVDGTPCPVVAASNTSITCTAPDLLGGSHDVVVRDPVYGDSNTLTTTYSFNINTVSPNTGGLGGSELVIDGEGFDPMGSVTVTVCGEPCVIPTSSTPTSSQITCVAPPKDTDGACDVEITNPDGSTVSFSSFTYDSSLTPVVSSLSKTRGGTAGGSTIVIGGTGFASSGNTVSIDGSPCVVTSESSTSITCVTEAHQGSGRYPVVVDAPGGGISTTDENGLFYYIDVWSSVYTWGGESIPSEGQLVSIEAGQTILMDQSTEVLKMLLIDGGHVLFDDEATEEIVLRAEYILIVGGGSLNIGSEEQPYEKEAVIELYGNKHSIELPHYGAKVLAVREGTLDIHGTPVPVTWTHLATTAEIGHTQITLNQPVTWKAGDNIIIATTEFRFFKNQNEERTIALVSADGRTLTLTKPLEHQHISIEQTLGGRTIQTRAEVGLLSRNVKIRGAINSDFAQPIQDCGELFRPGQFQTLTCFSGRYGEEVGSDMFGAQVMLFGKEKDQDLVQGRLSYTEVTQAGQAFQLGRYPIHFHLVGNVNTSYVRGCAIHRTFNRAVTIHATDYLTVEYNVAYNIMGHTFFTEDGNERFNTIQYNLAVFTRESSSLLNVDTTPASYWIVNPNNIVQHNAAAGGTHFGYWYRLEDHPTGPSATNDVCQNKEPMGVFKNNTAHSFGRYGLWVFSMDGYFPRANGCGGGSHLVAKWEDFTVWHCDRGAEVVFGGRMQFHNFVTLDNQHAGMEMVKVQGGFGEPDGPGIYDSTVIGHSDLSPNKCRDETSGIVAPKQEIFSIANTTFVNFDSGTCAALSGCSQCKPFQGGFTCQVKGLDFINADNVIKFLWEHETTWIDADGSLTGTAENVVLPTMGLLPPNNCIMDVDAFSINPEAKGSVCSNLKFVRFNVKGPSITPSSLKGKDLIVTNSHGSSSIPYRVKRLTTEGWMGVLYTGETYNWSFDNSEQITNFSYVADTRFLDNEDYYLVEHQLMQTPDGLSTIADDNRTALDAIPDFSSGDVHGDYYLDSATNTLTYLVAKEEASGRRKRTIFDGRPTGSKRTINFVEYRCQFEGCVPPTLPPIVTGRPGESLKWSDIETWKEMPVGSGGHPEESVYGLPVEGDDIIVPKDMWLVVDTATPPLGRVTVYGNMEFDDSMDHDFSANIIFIQGGRVIAGFTESKPFTHNLNIELRGSLDSTDPQNAAMTMPYPTPNLGWKAIGVFGELSLHGQLTTNSWFKLGATASVGDTSVTLAEDVDSSWINKEVMITSTGRDALETEIRTVTGVAGKVLTLDSQLVYSHLATTINFSETGDDMSMSGEVGLLTRNIVVAGNLYENFENVLGGRVLVSKLTQDGIEYVGSTLLSAVEFRNMGQLGYIDSDDPRYSLAFHSLGMITSGSSYVRRCSFNTNYNVALGMFDTSNFEVAENVFYHTVNAMILDESLGNIYCSNLLSVNLFPGTYNGATETQNLKWYGAMHLNKAQDVVLEDNVVSGSEQAGIMTYGEDCSTTSKWVRNEVHGGIFGVMMWKKSGSGTGGCQRLSNFFAWRVEDTAFYMQHHEDLLLSDVISVDNKLGVNQLVFGPPALQHAFESKTAKVQDSVFMGASPAHTCDFHQTVSPLMTFYLQGQNNFWEGGLDNGNTGILFGTFTSMVNHAPKHKFNEAATYPGLGGGSFFEDLTFYKFGVRSNCGSDVALMTNKDSDDAVHPIFTTGLTFVDTPEDHRIFLHRASLGRVNPSDCVDMDCDGLKMVVVQDYDGSLLGSPNATLTSEAEYEWDGDPSHGVGDDRIPTSLYQDTTGGMIDMDTLFPNKGIVRNSGCTLQTAWQGWKCTDITHRMLVLESLDSDTEDRRLSPIAFVADKGSGGYVSLVNGPMDRGWCFGYTCQERISTFYSVVADSYIYDVAMTSTPPQEIGLRMLHSDPVESVLLRIYFPKTQRYDVYSSRAGNTIKMPTNIDATVDRYQLLPENDSFLPKLTDDSGTNYLERDAKLLHVVLRGGDYITIKTVPQILLKIGIAVDPDEFYEDNVRQNIADLLGISPNNIRFVNVIREGSARKRKYSRMERAVETVAIELEIGSAATEALNGTGTASSGDILNNDQLKLAASTMVNSFQNPDSPLVISSLVIVDAVDPPAEAKPPATEEEGSVIPEGAKPLAEVQKEVQEKALNESLQPIEYSRPTGITLIGGVDSQVKTYTILDPYPCISIQDVDGDTVQQLGHKTAPWEFTATLLGGSDDAKLQGSATVPYMNGMANFSGLFVDQAGEDLSITFSVTQPEGAPTFAVNLTDEFNAIAMSVTQDMWMGSSQVYTNLPFNLTLNLMDADTEEDLDQLALQGQTMTVSMQLITDAGAVLAGDTSLTFAESDMSTLTVEDLTIDQPGSDYIIRVFTDVQPAKWNFTVDSEPFRVLDEGCIDITEVYQGAVRPRKVAKSKFKMTYLNNLEEKLEGVSENADNANIDWKADVVMAGLNLEITAQGCEAELKLVRRQLCYQVCMDQLRANFKNGNSGRVQKLFIADKECKKIRGKKRKQRCQKQYNNWEV